MNPPVVVEPILVAEIPAAVKIFFEGFGENGRHLFGDPPNPTAMIDVWTFAQETEPNAFLAARMDGTVIGYALFTSSVGALQRRAVTSGRIFSWMIRAISGRYGLRWSAVGRHVWNKMLFVGSSAEYRTTGDAQLLNIAVAPDARGHGVANALVEHGMRYLAAQRIEEVRLEVEPHNVSAIAVYRRAGFVERGRMRNVYGDWIVMTAQPYSGHRSGR